MKQRDVARMALGGVAANKLRSALTMLGVLIGVSAVIILVAVGTGSSRAVEATHRRFGHQHVDRVQHGPHSARACLPPVPNHRRPA